MANLNTINTRIAAIAAAEKITKKELGLLSRELLEYVVVDKSHDIDAVNRTLSILTPMNKKTAVLFFTAFLPFAFVEDSNTFGKMNKKKVDKCTVSITEFLAVEDNNIWTWAAENVKVEAKEVDWTKKISGDIQKATEAGMSSVDIIAAVMQGGITLTDIVAIMEQAVNAQEAA